jgi:predicted Na+-dependent transporter
MSHGYFLLGPFVSLGPLRNSEIANLAGFLSVIGLIIILGIALTIYSYVSEKEEKLIWNKFTIGFVSGAIGGAGFAYGLLENINIF